MILGSSTRLRILLVSLLISRFDVPTEIWWWYWVGTTTVSIHQLQEKVSAARVKKYLIP